MKDEEKKVNVKKENKEIKTKKGSVELTDEQLSQVVGGTSHADVLTTQGKDAGVQIPHASGQPGAGVRIRVR